MADFAKKVVNDFLFLLLKWNQTSVSISDLQYVVVVNLYLYILNQYYWSVALIGFSWNFGWSHSSSRILSRVLGPQ